MKSLEIFRKRMAKKGNSLRDEIIKNSRDLLEFAFEDSPSYTKDVTFWESQSNKNSYKPHLEIRLYDRDYSRVVGETLKFQTFYDDEVTVGDILYNKNTNEYYLCLSSHDINTIYWEGELIVCNWILKWQNKEGKILEYPCHIVNATQYNSGEKSNANMTIGSSQHLISLPYDENTVIIDSPQRFFLDRNKVAPTSYIVTQTDTTTRNFGKRGIIKVMVVEHPSDSKADNIELGICDYKEIENKADTSSEQTDTDIVSKVESLSGENIVYSGGGKAKFKGVFYSKNTNKVLENVTPKWNIIFNNLDRLEVNEVGSLIEITVDDDTLIGESLRLELSDEEGNYTSHIIVEIASLF